MSYSTAKEIKQDADIYFLLARAMEAGACSFLDDRDCGQSSNSIVGIAYDIQTLSSQIMPSDKDDLQACENMHEKLPQHRKTEDVQTAMERARFAIKIKDTRKGT